MKWLANRFLKVLGWRFVGHPPDIPKMVLVGAPHTSNWDFVVFLAVLHEFGLQVRYLGKHTLFRWPFGHLFRALGGIPVDRSKGAGLVAQVRDAFDSAERMILVVAPEGTRKAAGKWKSGFVKIAEGAGVPVVLAGVDAATKSVTFGPTIEVGADRSAFMDRVREFYADQHGFRTAHKGPVRLARETTRS